MDEDSQSFTPKRQGGPVGKQPAGNGMTWAVPTDPLNLDQISLLIFFSCLRFLTVVKAGISIVVLILPYGNQRLPEKKGSPNFTLLTN